MRLSRRDFLALLGAAPLLTAARRARGAPAPLRIAIAEAVEGTPARSAWRGATLGVEEARHAAALFGGAIEPTTGGGDLAADPNARPRPPHVVVSTSASEAEVDALASRAAPLGVLVVNAGCTADALRGARCRHILFHVAPSARMLQDAAREGGGEAVAWLPTLEAFGAAQLGERFRTRWNAPMDGDAWAGWFAVKAVSEAWLRAPAGTTPSGTALADALVRPGARFDGHKGTPLSFRAWDHQLRQPLYVARDGDVIDVPGRGAGTAVERLDRIGASESETSCRWSAS